MKNIYKKTNKIKIIGTRHGEKLFESLVSREEMSKSNNLKLWKNICQGY